MELEMQVVSCSCRTEPNVIQRSVRLGTVGLSMTGYNSVMRNGPGGRGSSRAIVRFAATYHNMIRLIAAGYGPQVTVALTLCQ